MAGLIEKLTAEKVKHHLEVTIHYIRLKLPEAVPIIIEVQRGKKMRQETQAQNYSPDSAFVQFDYPISFNITMHKKGEKYVKKNFVIRLIQVKGKNRVHNGEVKIEFSQIPVLKKPILRREVPLQKCADESAVVSISVKLEQIVKSSSKASSPNSSLLAPAGTEKSSKPANLDGNRSKANIIITSDPSTRPSEPAKAKAKVAKDPLAVEVASDVSRSQSRGADFLDAQDAYHNDSRDDSFNSKMSFSDLIINPKDSEVESESSSSEEEAKQLPVERLVAVSVPKSTREQVTPNEGSKSESLTRGEERSGIVTRREGNCCSACQVI